MIWILLEADVIDFYLLIKKFLSSAEIKIAIQSKQWAWILAQKKKLLWTRSSITEIY